MLDHVEEKLALGDLLVHAGGDHEFACVHLFIWCVEHFWCIVCIFLFGDAGLNTDVTVAKCVIFESDF